MKKAKLFTILKKSIVTICGLTIIWFGLAFMRFKYAEVNTNFNQALNDEDRLVIIYRPFCKRCWKTLPALYLTHLYSQGSEYVLNADKLSATQRDEMDNRITPTLRYRGKSYNTANYSKVVSLWNRSHY